MCIAGVHRPRNNNYIAEACMLVFLQTVYTATANTHVEQNMERHIEKYMKQAICSSVRERTATIRMNELHICTRCSCREGNA